MQRYYDNAYNSNRIYSTIESIENYRSYSNYKNYRVYSIYSFVTEGGIKERMHKARTGYRNSIDERLSQLEQENVLLKKENERLTNMLKEYETKYSNLKERALKAYHEQQEEIISYHLKS